MACCLKWLHLCAFMFIIGSTITFYLYCDTRTNTSFTVASRHLISLYNAGCQLSNGTKWYIQIATTESYSVQYGLADIVVGKFDNIETYAVTSVASRDISQNQFYQYTTKMPLQDERGLYYPKCVIITGDAVGQIDIVYILTVIAFLLMMILYVVTYKIVKRCMRDGYDSIDQIN